MLALLALLAPLAASAAAAEQSRIPVLLSTDMGNEIDDQWPLLHLLANPRFMVVGIASAHAPADSIPGAAGTSARIIRNIVEDRLSLLEHPPIVRGADEKLANERTPRPSEAAEFIIEASRSYSARRRLNLLVIGAASDAASALIIDPSLANRVRIIAMGFKSWEEGGDEFNIRNDPAAWRAILNSNVPVVAGDAAVTIRHLTVTRSEADGILSKSGAIRPWLMRDYDAWYDRHIKTFGPGKRADGSYSWPIWDHVVVAHLLGFTKVEERPRPRMGEDLNFTFPGDGRTISWITAIDRDALFGDFSRNLESFARTHATRDQPCYTIASEPLACWRIQNDR
jgi:inosine-uridine nucleoside N-ribohydrolase